MPPSIRFARHCRLGKRSGSDSVFMTGKSIYAFEKMWRDSMPAGYLALYRASCAAYKRERISKRLSTIGEGKRNETTA